MQGQCINAGISNSLPWQTFYERNERRNECEDKLVNLTFLSLMTRFFLVYVSMYNVMVQLDIYLQDPHTLYLQDPRVKLNVAGLDYTLTSYILTYTKKNRVINDKKVKLTTLTSIIL